MQYAKRVSSSIENTFMSCAPTPIFSSLWGWKYKAIIKVDLSTSFNLSFKEYLHTKVKPFRTPTPFCIWHFSNIRNFKKEQSEILCKWFSSNKQLFIKLEHGLVFSYFLSEMEIINKIKCPNRKKDTSNEMMPIVRAEQCPKRKN